MIAELREELARLDAAISTLENLSLKSKRRRGASVSQAKAANAATPESNDTAGDSDEGHSHMTASTS
jgi:hypothetical protein